MNFNLVQLPVNLLNVGDEIAVFDGIKCVGSTLIEKNHVENDVVQISASSADNYGMEGFNEGNDYKIRVWNAESGEDQELGFDYISGEEVFTKHESVLLSLAPGSKFGIEDTESVDIQFVCFPNPFRKQLTVSINLTRNSQISISVFDQLGQLVTILTSNEKLSIGFHEFHWNGTGKDGQNISAGIYFVQVSVDDMKYQNKIIVKH